MADLINLALFARLEADEELDDLLARSVIDADKPAIYATIPVPPGAVMPYVVAEAGDVSSENADTLADGGYRDVMRDISVYVARPDRGGGDASLVQAIAERIRALLHRQPLALGDDDRRNLACTVRGPIVNNGDNAFGRVLMVRYLVGEPVGA